MINPIELTIALIRQQTDCHPISAERLQFIENLLKYAGFKVERVVHQGFTHFWATMGDGAKHLAFVGHYDVVPGIKDQFEPLESMGYRGTNAIYGRGACDMKSGLAAMIAASSDLAKKGWLVSLLIAGDEEVDCDGMSTLLKIPHLPKIDVAICGEPTSREKCGDQIKVGRRGVLEGEILLKGEMGHAAYPHKTFNVMHALAPVIQKLTEPYRDGSAGFPDTSLSITSVQSKHHGWNVISDEVRLLFDARVCGTRSLESFLDEMNERLSTVMPYYKVTIEKRAHPFSPVDPNWIRTVERVVQSVTGLAPVHSTDGGTSDARFLAQKGIPVVEVGVPPFGIHSFDEHVHIEDLQRLVEIYKSFDPKDLSS